MDWRDSSQRHISSFSAELPDLIGWVYIGVAIAFPFLSWH